MSCSRLTGLDASNARVLQRRASSSWMGLLVVAGLFCIAVSVMDRVGKRILPNPSRQLSVVSRQVVTQKKASTSGNWRLTTGVLQSAAVLLEQRAKLRAPGLGDLYQLWH